MLNIFPFVAAQAPCTWGSRGYVVMLKPTAGVRVETFVKEFNLAATPTNLLTANEIFEGSSAGFAAHTLSPTTHDRLRLAPEVDVVSPNCRIRADPSGTHTRPHALVNATTDPKRRRRLATDTWGLEKIGGPLSSSAGQGVYVYVMGTGVNTDHTEFEGRAFPGLDAVGGTATPCCLNDYSCAEDNHGRGTAMAGIVGAHDYGTAPGVTILGVKIMDNAGEGYTSWAIAAETWILDNGQRPAVILRNDVPDGTEKSVLDQLVADGVPTVISAGDSA